MTVKHSTPNRLNVRVITRPRVRNPFLGAFRRSLKKDLTAESAEIITQHLNDPEFARAVVDTLSNFSEKG